MRIWLCNLLKRLERSQSERKRVAKPSRSILRSAPLSAVTLPGEGKKPQVPPLRFASVPRQAGTGGMTILWLTVHSILDLPKASQVLGMTILLLW